jgi:hypothetical protein
MLKKFLCTILVTATLLSLLAFPVKAGGDTFLGWHVLDSKSSGCFSINKKNFSRKV